MSYQLVTPHPHQRFPRIPGDLFHFPPFRGQPDRIPRNPGETREWGCGGDAQNARIRARDRPPAPSDGMSMNR